MIIYFLAVLVFFGAQVHSAEPVKCEWSGGDVGHITGIGEDYYQAQENLYTECFERRKDLFIKVRGDMPDPELQLVIMESCINIQCEAPNEQ